MTRVLKKTSVGIPWAIPLLLIVIWQLANSLNWVSSSLLPSPWTVIINGAKLWQAGDLQRNIAISLYRASAGLVIGGLLGLVIGTITGTSKIGRMLFDSTVQMLRNIPHLALIPLVIIWVGIGEEAKIILVAVGVFFPVYINTYHGIRSVDPQLIEMGRSYGLSKYQIYRKITWPSALPTILMGLRYALGVKWTTLIVSETVSASSGIGYMETNAQQFFDMKTVLLSILIYALLGKVSDWIAQLLENTLLSWR